MAGFDVSSSDLDALCQSISGYSEKFNTAMGELQKAINGLTDDGGFTGVAADAVKSYFSDVHGSVVSAFLELLLDLHGECAKYVDSYNRMDGSPNFRFQDSTMSDADNAMSGFLGRDRLLASDLSTVLGEVADIVSIGNPPVGGLDGNLQQAESEASNDHDKVAGIESQCKTDTSHLDDLESAVRTALGSVGACAGGVSYEKGSFAKSEAGQVLKLAYQVAKSRHAGDAKLIRQVDDAMRDRRARRGVEELPENAASIYKNGRKWFKHALDGAYLGVMVKYGKGKKPAEYFKGKVLSSDVKVLKGLARVGKSRVGAWLESGKKTGKAFAKALNIGENPKVQKLISKIPSSKNSRFIKDVESSKVGGAVKAVEGSRVFKAAGWLGSAIDVGTDVVKLKDEGFNNRQTAGLAATHFAVKTAAGAGGKAVGSAIGMALGSLIVPGLGTAIGSFVGGIVGSALAGGAVDKWVDPSIDKAVK